MVAARPGRHGAVDPRLDQPSVGAQVSRLLDELPRRFALAGLSLGGIVAMALVRTAPERVSRLALLSTNPYGPTETQRTGWLNLRQALAGGRSAREVQRSLLPVLLSPATLETAPDLVELTLAMADDLGEAGYDAQLRLQATRVDERPGLRWIGCPTMIISARGDQLCSVERHQEIADLVAGSELVVIENAAHLSTVEQPAVVSAHLQRWLAG